MLYGGPLSRRGRQGLMICVHVFNGVLLCKEDIDFLAISEWWTRYYKGGILIIYFIEMSIFPILKAASWSMYWSALHRPQTGHFLGEMTSRALQISPVLGALVAWQRTFPTSSLQLAPPKSSPRPSASLLVFLLVLARRLRVVELEAGADGGGGRQREHAELERGRRRAWKEEKARKWDPRLQQCIVVSSNASYVSPQNWRTKLAPQCTRMPCALCSGGARHSCARRVRQSDVKFNFNRSLQSTIFISNIYMRSYGRFQWAPGALGRTNVVCLI